MKSVIYPVAAAVLILFLGACTDKDLDPIFYTLEQERSLIDDRGLEDNITVHEVVKAGSRYFAAANTLYSRSKSGDWRPVPTPVSGALCNTLGVYGGNLYAGFYNIDGDGLGLYWTDPGTISWQQLADADVKNVQIGMIKAIGTNLYVSTAVSGGSPYNYCLYSSADGTSFNPITFETASSIDVPITDIEGFSEPPTEYWVIAADRLYADTDGVLDDLALQGGDPATSDFKAFGGLEYADIGGTDYLYLSSGDGKLWRYDGIDWGSPTEKEVDGDPVPFTRFVELAFTGHTDLLVGSVEKGYYELRDGSIASPIRQPAYNIDALYKESAILGFLADPPSDPTTLFAYTAGAGLWRADYVAGEWEWVQE
jgi:hypothetical protein